VKSTSQRSTESALAVDTVGMALSEKSAPRPSLSLGRVTRQSAINMAGGLTSQGLKFLVVIYLARRFSISEFGLLSFAIAINAYIFIVSNFGLPVFGSRLVAKSGSPSRELLAEVCFLRACLALLATVAAVAILSFVSTVGRLELMLIALFGLSNVAQAGLLDWAFQGLHRQEVSAILNVIWQGGWLALTVAGISAGWGPAAVPLALIVSAVLASVVGWIWLERLAKVAELSNGGQLGLIRRSWNTLRRAAPLGWGAILLTIVVWTDAVWVRFLQGERAVGIYAAGNRAALAVSMLGTFYVQGAFPLLSRAAEEGGLAFRQCLERVYGDLALIFVPGSLWAIFYAKQIVGAIFGRADYLAAVPVFRVFQIAMLLFVANNVLGTGVLVAFHRDREFQRVLWATAVLFLVLSPGFTWLWGIQGCAIAVLLTQGVSFLWFLVQARRLIWPIQSRPLFLPLLAGMAAIGAGSLMRLSLFGAVVAITLCYLMLLLARGRDLRVHERAVIG
jgi:O-antigen/teichoic acid export membrane protein